MLLVLTLAGGCAGSNWNQGLRSSLTGEAIEAFPRNGSPDAAPAKQTGSAARAASKLTATATPGSHAYRIGAQDVLEVSVFKAPELSTNVQVADSGTINLPLIGDVEAAGHTAQSIERDVTKRLGEKYLQRPQVRVFVKEYNSQRITVEGAVRKPGIFPYRGKTTLLQTIAMAEGLNDIANTDIVVFRNLNGNRAVARFSLSEIRAGRASDPALESSDIVVVPTDAFKETFQNVMKAIPIANVFALL